MSSTLYFVNNKVKKYLFENSFKDVLFHLGERPLANKFLNRSLEPLICLILTSQQPF